MQPATILGTLQPTKNLFVGAKVNMKADPKIKKKNSKALASEMSSLIRPKPNSKILGARVKLALYNSVDTPKGKGLRYLIKYKLGEPPVIASYSVLEKNRAVIQNRLENRGYFHDTVMLDTTIHHKKLTATYDAYIGRQYTIRKIMYPRDSGILSKRIRNSRGNKHNLRRSLFKQGEPYDLDIVKAERSRIDAYLKDKGFYYFNPEYLIAHVDSTVGDHKVDIEMQVKPTTPEPAKQPYRINDVIVYADYDIDADTSTARARQYHGYTIVDPKNRFNPKIFRRTLIFDSGDLYKRSDHNLSLNRLTTLGVYKFVKARFEPVPNSDSLLNAYYYLTPTQKKSLRAQVSGLTKSNNATGGELSLSWRNRSLFRGAELLTVTAYAGIEQQISGGINVGTRRTGVEANLYVPRIIAPFHIRSAGAYVPQTKFTAAYELFNRTTQYLLTSVCGSYGYVWKRNVLTESQFNLVNISSVQPTNITDSFQHALDTNVLLRPPA